MLTKIPEYSQMVNVEPKLLRSGKFKIGPKAREWDLQGCRPAPAMQNVIQRKQTKNFEFVYFSARYSIRNTVNLFFL